MKVSKDDTKYSEKLEKLEAMADHKKVSRRSSAYKLVKDALEKGSEIAGLQTIRPVWTSGSGRFTKNMDYTADVESLLSSLDIKFNSGNDSPRGGKIGNYIIVQV